MGPLTAAALIGGGASLISSFFGGKQSESTNMKMLKYQNEYNQPSNQIKRLKEAGLNPALAIEGSMSDISGNMKNTIQAPDYAQAYGSAASTGMQAAQVASNVKLAEAQAKLADAQANKTNKDASWVDILNGTTMNLASANIKEILSKIPVNEQTAKNLEAEFDNIGKLGSQIEAQTSFIKQHEDLLNKQSFEQEVRNKYVEKMQQLGVHVSESQISQNYAAARNFISAAAQADSQTRLNQLTYQIEDFLRANGTTYKLREAIADATKSGAVVAGNTATLDNATMDLRQKLANLRVMLDTALECMGVADHPANTVINGVGAVGSAVVGK